MDPLTLFALANGAVQAIKKGCQLYKDIKGAAGDGCPQRAKRAVGKGTVRS